MHVLIYIYIHVDLARSGFILLKPPSSVNLIPVVAKRHKNSKNVIAVIYGGCGSSPEEPLTHTSWSEVSQIWLINATCANGHPANGYPIYAVDIVRLIHVSGTSPLYCSQNYVLKTSRVILDKF